MMTALRLQVLRKQRLFDRYLPQISLAILSLVLFLMQSYFAEQQLMIITIERDFFPIVMLIGTWILVKSNPRYTINFIFILVLSLLFSGYYFWQWLDQIINLDGTFLEKCHALNDEPLNILLMLTILYCIAELAAYLKIQTLVQKRYLPFDKKVRLSRDKTLGHASVLYGENLDLMTRTQGVLLGQMYEGNTPDRSPLLRVHLEGNGLTIAPPRSGKFTNTLSSILAAVSSLDCDFPIVSIEPKGQAFCVWGRRRRDLGRQVVLLDPFSVINNLGHEGNKLLQARGELPRFNHLCAVTAQRFNPLDFITDDSSMVQKIDAVLEALIPHLPNANPTELHFNKAARRILAGFIAWVCVTESGVTRNLCRVYDLLNQSEKHLLQLLNNMGASSAGYGLPRDAAHLMLNVDAEERGSFFSTTTNAIDYLKYPEMRAHLSASDFDLQDLACNKLDIFVVVPQHLIEPLRTWTRLWVTLPLHLISERRPTKRIMMAIDELKALGYIKPLSNAYNLTSGYGLSIWGCTQAHSDLEEVYGDKGAKSMITCSQVVQFFNVSPADLATQNYVSSIIGDTTVLTRGQSEGKSSTFGFRSSMSNSKNDSLQETRQRYLAPEEISHLPENSQLLFIRHQKAISKPIYCYKTMYYQRPEFSGLFDPDPYQLLEKEQ